MGRRRECAEPGEEVGRVVVGRDEVGREVVGKEEVMGRGR